MTERVRGIGGVFFRSNDPEALVQWYADNLGVPLDDGYVVFHESRDSHVWAPFRQDTDYWPESKELMVNFIVDDLDAMLAQLREAGADVDDKVHDFEYGRFGWATDPEGNRIELWQPPSEDA